MPSAVTFGNYRFDAASGRLWAGDDELRLTPKASAVLAALVAQAGQPVSKDDLFATVWNGTAVSDDALTSCIQELRRVLGDDPKQPQYIETRHRRGYRFIAEVSAVSPPEAQPSPMPAAADIAAIAVLPFADMSPARDQDHLCEGLAEELINALTHVDGLRVASRTASFQFRSVGADIRAVGRHLNVGSLLEGSVRKADDRIRVTVQLIEVATGFHRWSQRFDRKLDDVFAIEDEIAETVATSLRGGVLSAREREGLTRPPTSAAAYEFYLRGRQHVPRMTDPDLQTARAMFERAIQLDPAYAPAFAGLTMVHATLYEWFGANDDDLGRADRASRRALDLAPNLSESHVARGFVLSLLREYRQAADEFREAIRLNPHLFDAYYYFARASFGAGEIAASAELFHKAGEVRHEDFQSPILGGQSLRMLGRATEAAAATREGIRRAEHMLALNPHDVRALSLGSGALMDDGQRERALEWSRRSLDFFPDDMSALFNAVCLHAKAAEKEEALALLERACLRGWGRRDWIEHDPDYDVLRDDPRFKELMARLK